jgi:hypothetical protein
VDKKLLFPIFAKQDDLARSRNFGASLAQAPQLLFGPLIAGYRQAYFSVGRTAFSGDSALAPLELSELRRRGEAYANASRRRLNQVSSAISMTTVDVFAGVMVLSEVASAS